MHWAMDAQGSIIHRSPDWLEFTGLSDTDIRSRIRSKAVHPDDFQAVEYLVQQALASQSPFLVTCRLRHGHDRYRWVVEGGSPALAPLDGSFLGYLGSTELVEDVSDVPRVEDILRNQGGSSAKGSVIMLDAMANHVLAAKAMAERNGDTSIAKALSMVLLLIGDMLYRSVNDRKTS